MGGNSGIGVVVVYVVVDWGVKVVLVLWCLVGLIFFSDYSVILCMFVDIINEDLLKKVFS